VSPDRWTPAGRALLFYEASELVNRYARAFDRKDWAALRTTYHDDAVDDHGSIVGSPDEFIEFMRTRHEHVVDVMHLNGNVLILEVDADRREALVETYCVGWQRLAPEAEGVPALYDSPLIAPDAQSRLCAVGNRYLDVLAERDGELRFLQRRIIYEWIQVTEVPLPTPFAATWAKGTRTEDDPSHTSLAALRRERERIGR
jgi:SnoaL-like protein